MAKSGQIWRMKGASVLRSEHSSPHRILASSVYPFWSLT